MFRSAQDIDGAIDEITRWADSLPGDFAIEVTEYSDGTTVDVRGELVSSGLIVEASIHFDQTLTIRQYRFHVRTSYGSLLWRHDRHSGHETGPGMRGPEHLHSLRAGKDVRLPADPVDLVEMREALVQANLDHAP